MPSGQTIKGGRVGKRNVLLAGWLGFTLAGTWFLWFDYNFNVFGSERTIGDTYLGDTPIRVVHLSVLCFAFGIVFLRRWLRRP